MNMSEQNLKQVLAKKQSILQGDAERIAKQRAAGKLTARERVAKLLDAGSFVETDALVSRNGDYAGVVTGSGTVQDRPVYVFAQDFTVHGGAMGQMQAQKIVKVLDLAQKTGAPVIALCDSAGVRIDEGAAAMNAYASVFTRLAKLSGVVPVIALVLGPVVGGAAMIAQLADITIEAENVGQLMVYGPQVMSAISGKTDDRPDFQRMIEDAPKRQFERVLVWKFDRFARNMFDSVTYKHELKKHGVKVISAMENIGEGDESVLLEAMLEASAEYYSLDLKKKIARGMRESALKGKFVGGAVPWWCSVNAEHKLIVIDERAAIVKEAFARYDSGEGSKSIVDDFAKRGLRSNRGMPVTLSWLLSILKNRKTIGEYTYNGIEIPGGLPVVVDKPLFDRVQERIARKRRTGGGEATSKTEYLLQGKLFCGLCGSPVTAECGQNRKGVVYNYYACSLKKKKHQCKKANERKDFLEWYVVEQTLDYVLTPDRTDYIAEAIVAEYERQFDKSGIKALEQKIALTEGEIQKTMDLCIQATTDAMRKRFMKRCEELDAKKAFPSCASPRPSPTRRKKCVRGCANSARVIPLTLLSAVVSSTCSSIPCICTTIS